MPEEIIHLAEYINQQTAETTHFRKLPEKEMMSFEIYSLPAGSDDPQQLHKENKPYNILSGRKKIDVDVGLRNVFQDKAIFIRTLISHRLINIEESLRI